MDKPGERDDLIDTLSFYGTHHIPKDPSQMHHTLGFCDELRYELCCDESEKSPHPSHNDFQKCLRRPYETFHWDNLFNEDANFFTICAFARDVDTIHAKEAGQKPWEGPYYQTPDFITTAQKPLFIWHPNLCDTWHTSQHHDTSKQFLSFSLFE